MRSREEYEEVIGLIRNGMTDSAIARHTGVPRSTVREWRHDVGRRHRDGDDERSGIRCDGRCDSVGTRAAVAPGAYAHLLGLYLGDGTISEMRRGVTRLRIFLDQRYPEIVDGCVASMMDVRGSERISRTEHTGCVEVGSAWKHWPCIFPQHGPGMKHTRPILLADWQRAIITAERPAFLKGLYESDGNRHINTVRRPVAGQLKEYHYSRYMFTNESSDIQALFKETCSALGVHWTEANRKNVAVSRRADVAFLDAFLGPKR